MGTEEMGSVPTQPQRYDNNGAHLNPPPPPQLLFHHGDTTAAAVHRFPPLRKATRELTIGFIDDNHRFFPPQPPPDFRRPVYASPVHTHPWNVNGRPTGDHGSDGDDDDEDEGDEELDDADGELIINNGSSNTFGNSSDIIGNNGSNKDLIVKEGNVLASGNDNGNNNNVRASSCENPTNQFQNSAVTIADLDGDLYYSHQYQQGPDGSNVAGHKDASLAENGCGFSRRKDIWYSSESGESLRGILSDPLTGSLMDDAMILPCGHSFGGGGMQHVITMKACYTCSQPVSEDSVATNLSLRAAVQAFRREEELQAYHPSKRREKSEKDKCGYGDLALVDHPRSRGVQYPFSVTDRVIIKGNKRTPQRFVGREAVVTTQCLNGWYVVKTLDNAESVKLQYRSLAKVPDHATAKPVSSRMAPNWL